MFFLQKIKEQKQNQKTPLLCAHRGGKQSTPENTLAAFSNALKLNCPCIELDLHLTLDKKIVVIHDETLQRTTNGKGYLHDTTLEQIKKLDAGSWYNPIFKDEKIPTLEEVLDLVQDKALLLIEIKDYLHPEKELEKILLKTLERYGMTYNCILHSFEKTVLDRLYEINPNLNLGFLFEKLPIHRVSYAKGLHPSKELLSKINPDDRQNHWVASWTFRSIADYQKTEEKDLPDILIADPIEDFCQFFQNKI